jgi:pyruvate/2-oxoglutarate dehydrogenase complex dihydrolipoamide acyltransferase (E2) component
MAQVKEIRVPDIGDFDGVPVIEVLVQPGDSVQKDQGLITLESDKATMEVPSPGPGTIKEVKVSEGDEVAEGTVIATYEPDESGSGEASDDDAESEAVKARNRLSPRRPPETIPARNHPRRLPTGARATIPLRRRPGTAPVTHPASARPTREKSARRRYPSMPTW